MWKITHGVLEKHYNMTINGWLSININLEQDLISHSYRLYNADNAYLMYWRY